MIVAFIAEDRPGSAEIRAGAQAEHRAHLDAPPSGVTVALSGPLLRPDGTPGGSLILFDAPDTAAVEAFMARDPNVRAGLYERTAIRPFAIRQGRL